MMRTPLVAYQVCAAMLAYLGAPSLLKAADGALSCVEEVGVPAATPYIVSEVPASAEVSFLIGADGRPEKVTFVATSWLRFEMQQAFVEKGRYSSKCKGQRLTFQVRYEVSGEATDHAESVTRFLPPNTFVVICHSVRGSVN
jgi:hypothetical protein